MSIKSGQLVTATDLNALKVALLTLYSNRVVSTDGRQLSNTNVAPYSTVNAVSASAGSLIADVQDAVINGVLVINDIPNVVNQSKGRNILANGTTQDLLTWVNTYKNETAASGSHGCRGACVGLCSGGCAGASSSGGQGPAGGTDYKCYGCTANCSNSCQSGCGGCGSCYGSCGSTCSGSTCKHQCTGCGAGCYSGCKNGCGWGCWNGCSTGCGSNCGGQCSGCSSACQNSCKDGCATDCTSGCYGSVVSGVYA